MKIGTIGTGAIVENFIINSKRTTGVDCIAIYSRNIERAKEFSVKHEIEKCFDDLSIFLNDAEIDTVYIASPNSHHFEHACAALKAGKNVICEKPFTSNSEELVSLIELAKTKRAFLFEAITTIHMPNFNLIKESLSTIGQIKFVQCNYSQYSKKYDYLKSGGMPNIFNTEFSGGALMDINVYNVHLAVGLFGKPDLSHYYPNIHASGIDTSGLLVMKYPEFIISCVGCKDSRSVNFVFIQGENGYIHIVNGANGCEKIEVNTEQEVKYLNQQNISEKISYEIKNFAEVIKNNDYYACNELLPHSMDVINIISDSRKDAGIIFPADVI